ncbi:hypothetical protein J6590_035867 [Homalodisca vitripennis]|nr:hypothetical protein J6590_035867 [Homalodisca vitripennis]
MRNAKDTCISYFHHVKLLESYGGNFEEFSTLFLNDSLVNAPFWKHILGYWEKRDSANMLVLKFEEMKKDLHAVIRRTATFLGKNLIEDQVFLLGDHLSFEKMKNNPAVNYEDHVKVLTSIGLGDETGKFMRSGQVGQWKTRMNPELIEQFDTWTEKELRDSGLDY